MKMDWQPIETAPKDGTEIVLYPMNSLGQSFVGKYEQETRDRFPEESGWYDNMEGLPMNPTHWMPLPDPPE